MRFVKYLELSALKQSDCDFVDNLTTANDGHKKTWDLESREILKFVPVIGLKNTVDDLIRLYGVIKSNSYVMRLRDSGKNFGSQFIDAYARINHSCYPNCISTHEGTTAYLIALRDIKKDEEVRFELRKILYLYV
jgi:hypothetical protein